VTTNEEPAWLARALSPVTEVRRGEAVTALLLTLNVFLLLTAYYLIKPVREALILQLESGAEYKAYMSGAIAIALLAAVPAYAKVADRLPRGKLVVGVTLFFASHLVLFFAGSLIEGLRTQLGLIFFLWVGIFNMMVVAQFWAFANDLYDPERGGRLFPLVALGASVGAAVGSKIAAALIPLFDVYPMLLVAAGLLAACAALFRWVDVREAARAQARPSVPPPTSDGAPEKSARRGAFRMVFQVRYLLLIALFSLVYNWVNTNGEYLLSRLIKAAAQDAVGRGEIQKAGVSAYIGAAYGDFFFYVNVLGLILQTFIVSRLVKKIGLGAAFFVLPAIALGGALTFIALPVLAVLRVAKVAENATDYSLNNTLRQMLWLVTTREMKYKAKQAVDTFFVRMGDVSSALLVAAGTQLIGLSLRGYAVVDAVLIVIWLVLAAAIVREHRRMAN
jgi:ATP:ADP antiporter, AAA family